MACAYRELEVSQNSLFLRINLDDCFWKIQTFKNKFQQRASVTPSFQKALWQLRHLGDLAKDITNALILYSTHYLRCIRPFFKKKFNFTERCEISFTI